MYLNSNFTHNQNPPVVSPETTVFGTMAARHQISEGNLTTNKKHEISLGHLLRISPKKIMQQISIKSHKKMQQKTRNLTMKSHKGISLGNIMKSLKAHKARNLIRKFHEKIMQQAATNLTRASHNDLKIMTSHKQIS
jgi:hypothetical protein